MNKTMKETISYFLVWSVLLIAVGIVVSCVAYTSFYLFGNIGVFVFLGLFILFLFVLVKNKEVE